MARGRGLLLRRGAARRRRVLAAAAAGCAGLAALACLRRISSDSFTFAVFRDCICFFSPFFCFCSHALTSLASGRQKGSACRQRRPISAQFSDRPAGIFGRRFFGGLTRSHIDKPLAVGSRLAGSQCQASRLVKTSHIKMPKANTSECVVGSAPSNPRATQLRILACVYGSVS